ncbi:MAG: AAA family ATPase [Actinomycetota bacterium]|nr:AAA family ATPase [Actinomycetota bacterium]
MAAYNIKGGVGKTSAAVNLAYLAAQDGWRTLLWDLDPQAAATYLFRIRPKVKGGGKALVSRRRELDDAIKATDFDGLDLLPADFSYRHMDLLLDDTKRPTRQLRALLKPVAGAYDLVVLDCPPSISLVSENIFQAADLLLVPLIPATLSLRTFDQLAAFVAGLDGGRPDLRAFFSMVDGRKRLHAEVMESLTRDRSDVLTAFIPAATDVERMGLTRKPVAVSKPCGRAAVAYAALWAECRQILS